MLTEKNVNREYSIEFQFFNIYNWYIYFQRIHYLYCINDNFN